MRDPSVLVAIVSALAALATGTYAYRSKRAETAVARDSGYVTGYVHLVDDLQEEIGRLRTQVAEIRGENARLYDEIRQLREQLAGLGAQLREAT